MKNVFKTMTFLLMLALSNSVLGQDSLYIKTNTPITMKLDRTFNSTLNGPGEVVVKKQYYDLQDIGEKIITVNGKITLKNNSSYLYADYYLMVRITTFDEKGNKSAESFHNKKYETTGKGEKQPAWIIPEGEFFIHKGGKFLIELLCTRVYNFGHPGQPTSWGGTFDITDGSEIIINKK